MTSRSLLLSLALIGTATLPTGCASTPPSNYPYASEKDPRRMEYVIAVGDQLAIRVWGHPELSADARVRPDGAITLPLIGDVRTAGLTPSQVRQSLMQLFSVFVKTEESSSISLSVTGVRYSVAVSGNVNSPGMVESDRFLTVSEAILMAGGPNRFASPEETVLLRLMPSGELRHIPINYEEVELGHSPEQNLPLFNGDRLYMP